ncbi:MAG: hypothetical protein ABL921_01130 [Pirellula sp.]
MKELSINSASVVDRLFAYWQERMRSLDSAIETTKTLISLRSEIKNSEAKLVESMSLLLDMANEYADQLRDYVSVSERSASCGLWKIEDEVTLKGAFESWISHTESLRRNSGFLSRVQNEKVSSYHENEQFVRSWIARQNEYESGTLVVETISESVVPDSWYQEEFERSDLSE